MQSGGCTADSPLQQLRSSSQLGSLASRHQGHAQERVQAFPFKTPQPPAAKNL